MGNRCCGVCCRGGVGVAAVVRQKTRRLCLVQLGGVPDEKVRAEALETDLCVIFAA